MWMKCTGKKKKTRRPLFGHIVWFESKRKIERNQSKYCCACFSVLPEHREQTARKQLSSHPRSISIVWILRQRAASAASLDPKPCRPEAPEPGSFSFTQLAPNTLVPQPLSFPKHLCPDPPMSKEFHLQRWYLGITKIRWMLFFLLILIASLLLNDKKKKRRRRREKRL